MSLAIIQPWAKNFTRHRLILTRHWKPALVNGEWASVIPRPDYEASAWNALLLVLLRKFGRYMLSQG